MRLFKFTCVLALICFCGSIGVRRGEAQSAALNNHDVVSMVKAGLPAKVIVAKIRQSSVSFDTSPASLEALKAAGVPNDIILAMVEASGQHGKVSSSAGEGVPPGKPRIYITDSQSWLIAGGFAANNGTAIGAVRGGSSPQTVELIKTFIKRCPQALVTDDKARASYVVLFDRESYKGLVRRRDKIAIFRRNGDALFSDSVRSVGNAVKDACRAILSDSPGK